MKKAEKSGEKERFETAEHLEKGKKRKGDRGMKKKNNGKFSLAKEARLLLHLGFGIFSTLLLYILGFLLKIEEMGSYGLLKMEVQGVLESALVCFLLFFSAAALFQYLVQHEKRE